LGPSMAEQQRAPRLHIVEEASAIAVFDEGSIPAGDEPRRASDGVEGANRGVHPTGYHLRRALEQLLGTGRQRWLRSVCVSAAGARPWRLGRERYSASLRPLRLRTASRPPL